MDEVEDPDDKPIVVLKAPLAKLLRDPEHLGIYRDTVKTINRVVTAAYLLARFIFVHAYEDDDDFNVDIYITTDFFFECLRALQTRTRRQSTLEDTLRNRRLIDRYIEEFCVLYRYDLIQIEGIGSNLERYIGQQMTTSYINNAEFKSSQHLRSVINAYFDVRQLRSVLRRQTATTTDKQLARAYLADISSFKDIISTADSYNDIESRIDEIRDLGDDYLDAFIFFAPWLEHVGNGLYRESSLWYELTAAKSVDTLYRLSKLNAMLSDVVDRPPINWQTFPLRHSFIPSYVTFDLGVVASHILRLPHKTVRFHYQHSVNFWSQHFRLNLRPFRRGPRGREFDGTFSTDGYGVSILKRTPGRPKGAGGKRKRGEKRQTRDERLFPFFNTIDRHDLREYQDVVFADPNIRDTLFMMHEKVNATIDEL